ncbi:uncharacterized protein M421DRAFT_392176 [Didymella exigua CBS 183.55]|uniref:Uncharacterized protein n=1 Tax=Didymella exigua CBS 183.55 TaxID=1150837 RepID=A0A6A5RL66_9PLEO|nr:uncharacterized protein M421DRAFT_392176 [Didymella exigua CBS 183.55]KAF1928399.1 hypothetical protein M421DRAFT_392176 [Didymella exigua CBS 183.55]
MAGFANSMRSLLSRGQPSSNWTPGSIARFDGMGDSHNHPQQQHCGTSLQQAIHNGSAAADDSVPPLPGPYEATGQDYTCQPAIPHKCSQPVQRFAVEQGGEDSDHMSDTVQELEQTEQELIRQVSSRTVTAQPSEAPTPSSHIVNHSRAIQLQDTVNLESAEVQVKHGPAIEEHEDHDMFAEFTNEDFHEGGAQPSMQIQRRSKSTDLRVPTAPSIKQEPESESLLCINVTERVENVDSANTSGRSMFEDSAAMPDDPPQALAFGTQEPSIQAGLFRGGFKSERLQSQVPHGQVTHAGVFQQKYAHDPRQSITDSQMQPNNGKDLRSSSVDSVLGIRRHSSEDKTSLLGGTDLLANTQLLAQQWQQRQKLCATGNLTANAVQARPGLLHSPRPTQDQSVLQVVPAVQPPQDISSYPPSPTYWQRQSSSVSQNSNLQRPACTPATQHGQSQSSWLISGWHFDQIMPQAPPSDLSKTQNSLPQGSVSSGCITEIQNKGTLEASDDDEPLATRVPRHRSTTAGPMLASSQLPAHSNSMSESAAAQPKPRIPNIKQDSAIKLLDDDDEDTAEPISWKLPEFEVTYHPPAAANDLPMAKVSILGSGSSENLVRSEVALTEDHALNEMELFLNVFLPAQRALQTPDPEPAHAVINFHTISVMVLEAFVQYEIGDEMGRGYGFHGGNVSNQALRPSPSSSNGEIVRTRSAKDADVDEIFFAVIDRWRAGSISGKGTLKLIRGVQEFCDIALDVIYHVKEHGLNQPGPKQRKERSDKGVKRGPRGGTQETETKGKATGKRKADAVECSAPAKKGKVNEVPVHKKAKTEVKKTPAKKALSKTKPKVNSSSVTVIRNLK